MPNRRNGKGNTAVERDSTQDPVTPDEEIPREFAFDAESDVGLDDDEPSGIFPDLDDDEDAGDGTVGVPRTQTTPARESHRHADPAPGPAKSRAATPKKPPAPVKLPHHLETLFALEGMDKDVLTGFDTSRAYIEIEDERGTRVHKPIAHLAPDALRTLERLRLRGHCNAELFEDKRKDSDPAYLAWEMPPRDDDDAETEDDRVELIRMEFAELRHEIRDRLTQGGKQVDLTDLGEKALKLLGMLGEGAKQLKGLKRQLIALIPEAPEPGETDDGGGDFAALAGMALGGLKKLSQDPDVRRFGAWLASRFGGSDGE